MTIHKKLIDFHKKFNGTKKTGLNPHFKSEYMTLDDVVKSTTPILNSFGLYVSHHIGDSVVCTSIVTDEGEQITSRFPLAPSNNPQVIGSQITYAKRYNLTCLLNIAEADDDGNAAAAQAPKPVTQETAATLRDYLDTAELNDQQAAFFQAHPVDGMTEDQAQTILNKLKAAA